jgi:type I restriction enzyme M protein
LANNARLNADLKVAFVSNQSQQIVSKAWNFAHVLRDDGLSYMAYTEQLTFLLFLKMADELTKPPYNRPTVMPSKHETFSWSSEMDDA